MQILNNVSLKPYNTFGVDSRAAFFASVHSHEQIHDLIQFAKVNGLQVLFMGGGSNLLFTRNYEGLVLNIVMKGISFEAAGSVQFKVTARAGENWSSFVEYCIGQAWGGLENLSLIPGSVGAAPIQNIGAYGVEIKDVIHGLTAIDLVSFSERQFSPEECKFGYRDSIFKQELKSRYVIVSVTFLLSTQAELNLSYPALDKEIKLSGIEPDIRSVADAVIRIRRSKIPDPGTLGNAGSFFKNPLISEGYLSKLLADWPDMPWFKQNSGLVKIPAAWLIEKCNWKGKRFGDAGVHVYQPLVLVNFGTATGAQIKDLAERIRDSVYGHFGILLEPEVIII